MIAFIIWLSFFSIAQAQTPPPPTLPTAPSGPTLEAGEKMHLQWIDNANNEGNFRVEIKLPGSSNWSFLAFVPRNIAGGITEYIDYRYIPGTYCYRVLAANDVGDSAYTDEACRDLVPPQPTAPNIIFELVNEVNTIKWVPVPGAINVHIYRKVGLGGAWGIWDTTLNSLGYYHDHRAAIGITYCYRLSASSYGGDSVNSNEVCDE